MSEKIEVDKGNAKIEIDKKMKEMFKLAEDKEQSVRFIMTTDTVHKDNEHKKIEKEEWRSEVKINDCSISLISYKSGGRALKRRTISQENKNDIISNYIILAIFEFEKEIIDIINDENISDFEQFQKLNSFFESKQKNNSELNSSFKVNY